MLTSPLLNWYQNSFDNVLITLILMTSQTEDATTWEDATLHSNNLYGEQPGMEDYYEWRDAR